MANADDDDNIDDKVGIVQHDDPSSIYANLGMILAQHVNIDVAWNQEVINMVLNDT